MLGTSIYTCVPPARDGGLYFLGPLIVADLVFYVRHLALGTTLGFGDACAAHKVVCVTDHLNTFLALTGGVLLIIELFGSRFLLDSYGQYRYRSQRPSPSPTKSTPEPTRPIPTPTIPLPVSSEVEEQPELQKKVQGQDRYSMLSSSASTLKDDDQMQKHKGDKRDSSYTIYSCEDIELGLNPERSSVPNPSNINPGSKPNQRM
ncbi:hypothetical protein EC991_011187 [Linnemannia zychae]|nr:hypothetical protein EC991_011187 [Linnemannia zychae]